MRAPPFLQPEASDRGRAVGEAAIFGTSPPHRAVTSEAESQGPGVPKGPVVEISDKSSLTWTITPDLLGVLDRSGRFRDTNPAWFRTLGISSTEIETKPFFEFVHPDDIRNTEKAFDDIKTGAAVLGFENRYRHADGSYRWLSWNAVPVDDLFFCSARDVTAQKTAEAALRTREDEAALREQFIAVLGHDLRNPLAAITSGMRLIRRSDDLAYVHGMAEMMGGSVARMAGLIDDVMDFTRARLGIGLVSTCLTRVRLTPTLVATMAELRLAHPGATIVETLDFDEPVACEPGRIAQLLSNLLSNAITHGDRRRPVHVKAFDHEGDFVLSVENAGKGIAAGARATLFEPFARADVRDAQNGLGLGLFIASEIARGHGGALTFASDDRATVFTLTIPKGTPAE